MSDHGLFSGASPPSPSLLKAWLDANGITVSPSAEIFQTPTSGWALQATADLATGDILCLIPKTALLSERTTSLPPLALAVSGPRPIAYTILHLSLILLHEFRMGESSTFWGYLQSLPREMVMLPVFWGMEGGGEDGKEGLRWLQGTEGERDLRRREDEGLGLESLRSFYLSYASHLPPTSLHPTPSPFQAFLHAYSLISTRAFLIDLYQILALVPYADLLNHSSTPQTSLASDEFVCHICGLLRECPHDIPNSLGVPRRLEHLPPSELRRIESEDDCVEMRVEREVRAGEQVFNTYGEGMGDGRLLIEWGFVGEEYGGEGLNWDVDELASGRGVAQTWLAVLQRGIALDVEEDESSLLCPASRIRPEALNLNQEAQGSINLFALLHLRQIASIEINEIQSSISGAVGEVESAWARLQGAEDLGHGTSRLSEAVEATARALLSLLEVRLGGMYKPDLLLEDLFELRDSLGVGSTLQQMAMTVAIGERDLLLSARAKWRELLGGFSVDPV